MHVACGCRGRRVGGSIGNPFALLGPADFASVLCRNRLQPCGSRCICQSAWSVGHGIIRTKLGAHNGDRLAGRRFCCLSMVSREEREPCCLAKTRTTRGFRLRNCFQRRHVRRTIALASRYPCGGREFRTWPPHCIHLRSGSWRPFSSRRHGWHDDWFDPARIVEPCHSGCECRCLADRQRVLRQYLCGIAVALDCVPRSRFLRSPGVRRGAPERAALAHFAATTFACCSPRPSMPRRTTSPGFSHFGFSFMPWATPGGVPVTITSPGSIMKNCEQYQTMWAAPKIMVRVEPFCRLSPFTVSHIFRFCGSLISSLVTSHGPIGPKFSALLPLIHCPARSIWNWRSETSLARQ